MTRQRTASALFSLLRVCCASLDTRIPPPTLHPPLPSRCFASLLLSAPTLRFLFPHAHSTFIFYTPLTYISCTFFPLPLLPIFIWSCPFEPYPTLVQVLTLTPALKARAIAPGLPPSLPFPIPHS
ncbi:hypothetical protein V8E36_002131, partial [Tilletia maclaganii]